EVGPEEERVVHAALPMQELEQLRRMRALLRRPGVLVRGVVRLEQDTPLEVLEVGCAAGRDGEPVDRDAVDRRRPDREVGRPGPVVERGRSRDLHVMALGEPARGEPGVLLGPSDHLLAVSLYDDENSPPHLAGRGAEPSDDWGAEPSDRSTPDR